MRHPSKIILFTLSCMMVWSGVSAQEIALELHSLRNQFDKDIGGTMAKVKEMGFKDIGVNSTYGLSFPDFIKQIAVNELNVITYGADFDKIRDFPQAIADEARMYGAKYVVCSWIPHTVDSFTVADIDKATEVFNRSGQIMARNGLLLCYHPHGYEFKPYSNGTMFDYMTQKFDNRFVQFQMDVFWIKQAGQDPLALLKKYHSRWILLQLKDRKSGTSNTIDGHVDESSSVTLGEGDVGIAEIYKEAKRYGIQYIFIEDESPIAEQQIPKSIAFLKSLEE